MGLDAAAAGATLRLGLGRFTSPAEADQAARMLCEAWAALVNAKHAAE